MARAGSSCYDLTKLISLIKRNASRVEEAEREKGRDKIGSLTLFALSSIRVIWDGSRISTFPPWFLLPSITIEKILSLVHRELRGRQSRDRNAETMEILRQITTSMIHTSILTLIVHYVSHYTEHGRTRHFQRERHVHTALYLDSVLS